jgi:tRNA threonylcarbamoyladenosine biosynthesis protein TsaE
MKYQEKICYTKEETKALAKTIAKNLKGGEILALYGDIGSGKTTFCQGIGEYFQVIDKINSPTFVIMKLYKNENNQSKVKMLVHIDSYRLKDLDELKTIGAFDFIGQKDTVSLVEWPQLLENKYSQMIRINFKSDKDKHFISYPSDLFPALHQDIPELSSKKLQEQS